MIPPWWAWTPLGVVGAGWAYVAASGEPGRLLGRWLRPGGRAPEREAGRAQEPGWPPFADDAAPEARPVLSVPETVRLHDLACRLADASPGARSAGESLAARLTDDLPGMAGADIARVLLALQSAFADAVRDIDSETAVRVIADGLDGAAPLLAEVEMALARGEHL